MESRMSSEPHPYWATHAMRFKGFNDFDLIKCHRHALENLPTGTEFAIRRYHEGFEWYTPIGPPENVDAVAKFTTPE